MLVLIVFGLLSPGLIGQKMSASHDGAVGLTKMVLWKDAMDHGIAYPRWIPFAAGGQGIPTFVFYQPGFFLFISMFAWLPMFPFLTFYVSVFVLLVLAMWAVYSLINEYTKNAQVSFISAVFFGITPYIYISLNVRGSFTELTAMLLSPLPIAFLVKFKDALSQGLWKRSCLALTGLVLSLSYVMISHPVGLVIMPVIVFVFGIPCFFDLSRPHRKRFFLWVINALLTSAVMSSFYWGPVFALKEFIMLNKGMSGIFVAALNTVSLKDLFLIREWGFDAFGAPQKAMLTPIGLPHFVAACFGAICFWRNRFVRMAFFVLIGLIILMLPVSAPVWRYVFFLRYFQFPWRLLSFTALPLAICFSGGVAWIFKRVNRSIAWALSMACLAVAFLWYPILLFPDNALSADKIVNFDYKKRVGQSFDTLSSRHEVVPVFCKMPDYRSLPQNLYSAYEGIKVAPLEKNSPYHLHYALLALQPAEMIINQLYFPGWRVSLDGEDIPDTILRSRLSYDGKIRIWLPAGEHTLEAYYAGVPGEVIYWVLSGVFFVGFISASIISMRKKHEKML